MKLIIAVLFCIHLYMPGAWCQKHQLNFLNDTLITTSPNPGSGYLATPSMNAFHGYVFFIDGIKVLSTEVQDLNNGDIATVSVYKDSNALRIAGPDAKNGVIYIETKQFVRNKYWNFFGSKSPAYALQCQFKTAMIPLPIL